MIVRPLLGDRRGVALIEFAIVLPVLLLLFLGGFNLARAMSMSRKATVATHVVADLASQQRTTTKVALTEIMSVKAAVARPFNLSETVSRITHVRTNGEGVGHVIWSHAAKGEALRRNRPYALPDGVRLPGTTYIIAETEYAYHPIGSLMPSAAIAMSERAIVLPRQSQEVQCDDCD